MGFCKNCGSEHDQKAVVCIKCGCLIDNDAVKEVARGRIKSVLRAFSSVAGLIVVTIWLTLMFAVGIKNIYGWAMWLLFTLTFLFSAGGLAAGIYAKDRFSYLLNTVSVTMVVFIFLALVL